MAQKMQLTASGRVTVSQLCEDFDISRKTGHKWWGEINTSVTSLMYSPR